MATRPDPHGRAAPEALAAGRLLPDLKLSPARGGPPVAVRGNGREVGVLVFVHGSGCDACRAYVRELAGARQLLGEWGARLLVVSPEPAASAARLAPEPTGTAAVAADPDGAFGARTGLAPAAVLVADAWGELYHVAAAGPAHELPGVQEIVDWVRFVAIQCPECEGPEGAWREL